MTIYQVSGCVHRFEKQFGLVKEKEDGSPIEKPAAKEEQAIHLLEKTIYSYSKKDNCCGKVKRFFYIVWQAVKRLFCGGSDWQNTTRMLSGRIKEGFESGAMTPEQIKTVTAELDVVAENILLQLLQANEGKKSEFDGFEFRTSSHKVKIHENKPKRIFAAILRELAQTCFVTPNCKDFIASLPKGVQRIVNQTLEKAEPTKKIQMIEVFEKHCKEDSNYVETTRKKVSDSYDEIVKIDAGKESLLQRGRAREPFTKAAAASLNEAFGTAPEDDFFIIEATC